MNKTYSLWLVAGAIVASGLAMTANAQESLLPAFDVPSKTVAKIQRPAGPEFEGYFDIIDGVAIVEGVLYAPTEWLYDWETQTEARPIEGTMTIRVVKSCYDLGIKDELVAEYLDVVPDQKIEWSDPDVVIGQGWTYRGIAIVDGIENDEWYSQYGVYTGIRPLSVTGLTIKSENGAAPVTVSFKVPDGVRSAEDFPGIIYKPARVYITRQFQEIDSWDYTDPELVWEAFDPEFDKEYTFVDDNNGEPMPEGTYAYNVYVAWMWGESFEESKRVGLFFDKPENPENVKAANVADGVLITWDAVTEAGGLGYLDPASVVYDVYRYFGYDDTQLIASDLTETKFIDNLEGIDKPTKLEYQVIAKNEHGESDNYYGRSNSLVVGPAAPLPFTEAFSVADTWGNVETDNIWIEGVLQGNAYWGISNRATYYDASWNSYYIYPTPPSMGLAYTAFSSWSPDGEIVLTSNAINFKGHDAGEVTLSYHTMPGCLVNLAVEIMTEFDPTEGGQEVSPYALVKTENPTTLDTAKTETVWSGSANGEEGWQSVTVPFSGFGAYDTVYVRIKATQNDIPEDGIYIPAAVQYISLDATDEYDSVQGINADAVSSEYYNLQGIRVAAPVKGEPTIRRSVMSDGSVRTSKVIVK